MQLWMITAFLTPCLIGIAIQRMLGFPFSGDAAGFCGRVFPIGFLCTAMTIFCLMAGGIPVNNLLVPHLIFALSIGLIFKQRRTKISTDIKRPSWPSVLLLSIAGISVVGNTAPYLQTPVHTDDDAAIWTMKAKVLHAEGRFNDALGDDLRTRPSLHHQDYPLLNPLTQVWLLSTSNGAAQGALRVPTMLWALSLLLLLFSTCSRYCGPIAAAMIALTVVTASIFQQATTGTKSDVMVVIGLLGFVDFAQRCRRDPSFRNVWALALFGGILVWSKNEGLMLILAATAAFATTRLWTRAFLFRRAALPLILPCLIVAAQVAFNSHYDLRNDLLTGGEGKDARPLHRILIENTPEKLPTIASAFCEIGTGLRVGGDVSVERPMDRMTILLRSNGLFLLALFLLTVYPVRLFAPKARPLTTCLLLSVAGFMIVYIISFEPLLWHLYTSATRVLFHLSAPIAILIAMIIGEARDAIFPVTSTTQSS